MRETEGENWRPPPESRQESLTCLRALDSESIASGDVVVSTGGGVVIRAVVWSTLYRRRTNELSTNPFWIGLRARKAQRFTHRLNL